MFVVHVKRAQVTNASDSGCGLPQSAHACEPAFPALESMAHEQNAWIIAGTGFIYESKNADRDNGKRMSGGWLMNDSRASSLAHGRRRKCMRTCSPFSSASRHSCRAPRSRKIPASSSYGRTSAHHTISGSQYATGARSRSSTAKHTCAQDRSIHSDKRPPRDCDIITIVIVDDDAPMSVFLRISTPLQGHHVIVAASHNKLWCSEDDCDCQRRDIATRKNTDSTDAEAGHAGLLGQREPDRTPAAALASGNGHMRIVYHACTN